MRKLEIADAAVMRLTIQEEINRSEEPRYDHRLHALLLVANGQSCRQAALLLGMDPRTVQRRVRAFEERGLEGLRDGERPGRPRLLDAAQWVRLEKDLRRPPSAFGLAGGHWDGPLLSEHVRRRYGAALGVRQCQRVLREMGFRPRKPRPRAGRKASGS